MDKPGRAGLERLLGLFNFYKGIDMQHRTTAKKGSIMRKKKGAFDQTY